ncbi:TIGR00282 family metallophosphoesterase [Hyphococcus flavus]|uniref:TIGR00282 family metallophosphoesterase n=1 Tax=Hyphococcus flavus TaxID=1866326 RepID=A0AAE9ZGW1_9PROT|nr:TIGR00282 family metallophosphoesterase [Hyphococcus flavus]WDI32537.1 TIGR00282 family metallophosphoesterase [Hyphococcus flavus]
MRIAVFGDVMGRSGRTALLDRLPSLKTRYALDFTIVNVENAAGGFGVTAKIADDFIAAGADVLTTGNHAYDQREEIEIFDREERLLRPVNFPKENPGRGSGVFTANNGSSVLVVHAQGQIGMPPGDDPFSAVDRELAGAVLGKDVDAIVVDFHAEATSEKNAMGHFLDGRASLVVGTHTHIPTADDQILPRGTGYITDLGMSGDYDSVIGMEKSEPLRRFITKIPGGRFSPAAGEATISGVIVETDENGLAQTINPIRLGGRLKTADPVA